MTGNKQKQHQRKNKTANQREETHVEISMSHRRQWIDENRDAYHQLGARIRCLERAETSAEDGALREEHGMAYDVGQGHFRCLNDEWILWNEFPMSGRAIRTMCNNGIYRGNMFNGGHSHALDAGVRYMQSELLKSGSRFESLLSTDDMNKLKSLGLLCGHLLKQLGEFLKAERQHVSKQRSDKDKFVEEIRRVIRGIKRSKEFSELRMDCEPFGSHLSTLDDSSADIDLCIHGRGRKGGKTAKMLELRDLNHDGKKNILLCIMHRLRSQGFSVVPIVRARVPLLKVNNKEKTFSCDIVCVCNKTEGIHKSLALRCIKDVDDRLHDVLILVKKWATKFELRDASLQRLNSYALTQLVIFHFQTRPVPILPPIRDLMRIPWQKDAKGVKNRFATDLNWYPSDGTRLMEQPFPKRKFMIDVMGDNSKSFDLHRSHGDDARGPTNKETVAELLLSFFVLVHGLSRGWKGPNGKNSKNSAHKNIRISTFHACIYAGEHPDDVIKDLDAGNDSTKSPIFIEDPFDSSDNCARSLGKECLLKMCQASERTLQSLEQLKQKCTHWMQMPVTSEVFSLWYVPPPGSLQKVQETIQQLSSRYSAPVFPAHMTLVGGIRAPEATVRKISKDLVDKLEPVEAHVTCVDYGSMYHQCVFLKVDRTEDLEIQRRLARKKFSMDENVEYMPHISLLYSDIDQKEREKLTREQQEGSFDDMGRRVGFERVELWYTPPEDVSLGSWRRLETYSLKNK